MGTKEVAVYLQSPVLDPINVHDYFDQATIEDTKIRKILIIGEGIKVVPEPGPFQVMLRACLMEHEGIDSLVDTHPTRRQAENWIAQQKDQYFKPSDYYVTTEKK